MKNQNQNQDQIPIFRKLFHAFSAFALIPVVVMGVLSLVVSVNIMYRNLKNDLSDTANQTAMMVDAKLEEMKYISENFVSNTGLKHLLRLPASNENLMLLNQELESISSMNTQRGYQVTLCGVNGQIYLNWYSDGMIYRNSLIDQIRKDDWYSRLEHSRSLPVWIPYMDNIAQYDQKWKVFTLARNIMNDRLEGEEVLGFVVISVPSTKISGALPRITERTYIIDANGQIVMSRNEEEMGTLLEGTILDSDRLQRISIGDAVYLGNIKANENGGLYTVVLTPVEELWRQIFMLLMIVGFSIALCIGMIFLVAYFVSKSLSSPILALEGSMRRVQEGHLEKTKTRTNIMEIMTLSDNFNIMVDRIGLLIIEKVEEEQKRKEIEVEKANAELKFLRAQIMPHFLFNTLNSIKWLAVIHGAAPVEEMITALGRLLECSMQKGNDFIPLEDELENVKAYLKIQGMRYGSSLKAEYEIEDGIRNLVIPKLILQPIVENAVIHGINKNEDGGLISVRVYTEEEKLLIEVEDDGPDFPENVTDLLEEKQTDNNRRMSGIGVYNVNKRIQLIYGKEFGLCYRRGDDNRGTVAVLALNKEERHVERIVGR